MLTVIDAAESQDLVTLDGVRAALGITTPSEQDEAKLSALISQASDAIARHCNRVFALETVTETFRVHSRTRELMLTRYPVTAIASIVENDVTLTDDQYEADLEAGFIERLSGGCVICWPPSRAVVTYSAGYGVPDDLPAGIQRATLLLISHYRALGDRDPTLKSFSALGGLITEGYFGPTDSGLPADVEGALIQHRKPAGA